MIADQDFPVDPFPIGSDVTNPQLVMQHMDMSSFIGMTGVEAAQALVPIICKMHDAVTREHQERRRK